MRAAAVIVLFVAGMESAGAQFVRFAQHGTAEGLGNLAVTAVGQDLDGAILVGTEGGLYRYDGAMFQAYADQALPASTWIHQILFDQEARLWLSTGGGIFMRRPDGSLAPIVPTSSPNDLISSSSVAEIAGAMVFEVNGQVETTSSKDPASSSVRPMFDPATLARVPALNKVAFLRSDPAGGLLLGCGLQICHVARDGNLSLFGAANGLPAEKWYAGFQAPDGTLWARGLTHLAWRKPGDKTFSTMSIPGGAQSFFTGHPEDIDLVADGQGGIFTGSDDGVLQRTGGNWRIFSHHVGGLPSNIAHAVFLDREGSMWVGGEGGGVSRALGLGKWEHWTSDDGLPNNTVWSMAQTPSGTLWVTTDHGTVELNGRRRRLAGSNYAIAVTKEGRLWIDPLGQPLQRLDDDAATPERFQPVPNALNAVVDRADRLWLATRTTVTVVPNADAPANRIIPRVVLSGSQFEVGLDRSGSVWAMDHAHLYRQAHGDQMAAVPLPPGPPFQPTDFTFAPDGTLWIGTDTNGVSRFRVDGNTLAALPRVGTPQIASDSVLFVRGDHRGWMWVGTDHGISVFNGKSVTHVDSSDGPLSNDLDQESVLEDRDGSMWFGTSSGLSHLVDPTHLAATTELHPQVTSITYGARASKRDEHLRAPWISAPLVVRVDDFDFNTGPLLFRYRLVGVDRHWDDTASREIRYTNLPAGRFVFETYAVDASHGRVSHLAGVAIRIRPPWWRRWWFYLLSWMAGASAIASAWLLRIGYLVRQRAQLEELVRYRTIEIEAANDRLTKQSAIDQHRLEEMVRARTIEIEIARQELHRLALSDALTGLPNRRAILAALDNWLSEPCCDERAIAALLMDVDHFKLVNDNHGHIAGDEVLSQCGAKLAAAIHPNEVASRFGGEEFLVILRGRRQTLVDRAEAVWRSVSEGSYVFAGVTKAVTASAGLAILRDGERSLSLIERADASLYRAKAKGRARLEVATDLHAPRDRGGRVADTPAVDTRTSSSEDCSADERGRLFQPIVTV